LICTTVAGLLSILATLPAVAGKFADSTGDLTGMNS
jgi:hypothetical protein